MSLNNDMRELKIMLLVFILVFIIIQFSRPERNLNRQILPADFSKSFNPPANLQGILTNACYDCHSNNTRYPWYTNIQPMAWIMGSHIKNGKDKLNFSEFRNYSISRQISKLKGIANSIKDGIMPLTSYELMHKNARLTEADKSLVIDWIENKADSLSNNTR